MNNNWLGVAAGQGRNGRGRQVGIATTLLVDAWTRADITVAGAADGFADRNLAAAPAACGVAIDVPLIVLVAVSLSSQPALPRFCFCEHRAMAGRDDHP